MAEFTDDFSETQLNPQYWILNNKNDYWDDSDSSGLPNDCATLDTVNQKLVVFDHDVLMTWGGTRLGSATLFGFDLSNGFSLSFDTYCPTKTNFRIFLSNTTSNSYFLEYKYNSGNPTLGLVWRENGNYYPVDTLTIGQSLNGTISIDATPSSLTITYNQQTVYNGTWDGPLGNGIAFVCSSNFAISNTTVDNLNLQTIVVGPVADFTEDVTVGTIPLTVQFTDASTNELPTSWFWNFGDGNTSEEQNPEHTYLEARTYDVSLIVANENGQDTKLKQDLINAYPVLVSAPSSSPTKGGIVPAIIQFSEESGNDKINSWLWDFGDGTTSTEQNPIHTYNTPGTYSVSLTVSDGIATDDSNITIIATESIIADFTANVVEGEAPLTVQFTNISENATNYLWNFGDGTVSVAENPTHVYTKPGVFNVQLISRNEIESKSEIKSKLISVGSDFQFKLQTQTFKTQGRYPEFGLLKSEIFAYLAVIPEITPMSDYFLIYNRNEWDCGKVWAGGDYSFGAFYVDIPIADIPANIVLLTQEELQNIVNKCAPFGTKGIPRYIHKKKVKIGAIMTARIQGEI